MDTIIIGAGASGLACAVRIKQNNPKAGVTVLERMQRPGKKILATGNGRCNLSNKNAPHCREVLDFFHSIGLATRHDAEGRIYPYSNRADTVLGVLLDACERLGVNIVTDCTVTEIDRDLIVNSSEGSRSCDAIVVAAGGTAQKNLGSNGSGYALLKSLGHKINPIYPSLVQLTSSSKYPRKLKGHRVKCDVSILIDGENAGRESGEVLFTDYGLSGIAVMDLSAAVSRNFAGESPKKCHAVLDLIPDMDQKEAEQYLNKFHSLNGILGKDLADILSAQAKDDSGKTALYAKNWKLIITGTKGFEFAQITGGGADVSEFDNFESRLVKGVYACGEVLDRQFKCGGYNLNFAWYSGIKTADKITSQAKGGITS